MEGSPAMTALRNALVFLMASVLSWDSIIGLRGLVVILILLNFMNQWASEWTYEQWKDVSDRYLLFLKRFQQ